MPSFICQGMGCHCQLYPYTKQRGRCWRPRGPRAVSAGQLSSRTLIWMPVPALQPGAPRLMDHSLCILAQQGFPGRIIGELKQPGVQRADYQADDAGNLLPKWRTRVSSGLFLLVSIEMQRW